MPFVVDATEVHAFGERVGAASAFAEQRWGQAMDRSVLRVQGRGRENSPVDTGRLRNSIKTEVTRGSVLIGRVGTSVVYALAVHDGRRAVRIVPVNKKVLRFVVGGRVVFAKFANQPARAGNPFLARALNEMRPLIVREFEAGRADIYAFIGSN